MEKPFLHNLSRDGNFNQHPRISKFSLDLAIQISDRVECLGKRDYLPHVTKVYMLAFLA